MGCRTPIGPGYPRGESHSSGWRRRPLSVPRENDGIHETRLGPAKREMSWVRWIALPRAVDVSGARHPRVDTTPWCRFRRWRRPAGCPPVIQRKFSADRPRATSRHSALVARGLARRRGIGQNFCGDGPRPTSATLPQQGSLERQREAHSRIRIDVPFAFAALRVAGGFVAAA
jgi:hypothetical protein